MTMTTEELTPAARRAALPDAVAASATPLVGAATADGRQLSRCARVAARVESAIESIGYRLLAVEIDAELGRARVEVRRQDGYTLTLDVRNGAGTITRERVRVETATVGRRGDRSLADRIRMEFLGRSRVTGGARAALRAFASVIGENSSAGRLAARDAIRLLLPTAEPRWEPRDDGYQPTTGRCSVALRLDSAVSEFGR